MKVGQDLEKILQFDRKPRDSDDKEAFVGLYVDIIQVFHLCDVYVCHQYDSKTRMHPILDLDLVSNMGRN